MRSSRGFSGLDSASFAVFRNSHVRNNASSHRNHVPHRLIVAVKFTHVIFMTICFETFILAARKCAHAKIKKQNALITMGFTAIRKLFVGTLVNAKQQHSQKSWSKVSCMPLVCSAFSYAAPNGTEYFIIWNDTLKRNSSTKNSLVSMVVRPIWVSSQRQSASLFSAANYHPTLRCVCVRLCICMSCLLVLFDAMATRVWNWRLPLLSPPTHTHTAHSTPFAITLIFILLKMYNVYDMFHFIRC